MTNKELQGMLMSLELIKHGAKSNSKYGKIASGHYELKNWQYYTIKVSNVCAILGISLFILYGITKLFM